MLTKAFHQSRREAFADLLPDRSIGLLYSGDEKTECGDQNYPFSPDRNFYYLTGYAKPRCYYVGWKVQNQYRDILFIEQPNARQQLYHGKMSDTDGLKEQLGFSDVRYTNTMQDFFSRLFFNEEYQTLYLGAIPYQMQMPQDAGALFVESLRKAYPFLAVRSAYYQLGVLRSHKQKEEIEAHRKACLVTEQGVKNMLRHIRPGITEGQLEAYFDFSLKQNACGHAFETIAASGPNSCVLHYSDNDRMMKDGDVILFDLGASSSYYCADVSRTYPVNGTFTERQKLLYEVVLKGLDRALELTKPGQAKHLLQQESKRVMAEELQKLGIIESPEDIDRYYCHGSGHFIGLYTHDVGDDAAVLEEDMVFTLEPGLYFPEEEIGIRIEDTLVVTASGYELLSGGIPKTVEEIEAFIKHERSRD